MRRRDRRMTVCMGRWLDWGIKFIRLWGDYCAIDSFNILYFFSSFIFITFLIQIQNYYLFACLNFILITCLKVSIILITSIPKSPKTLPANSPKPSSSPKPLSLSLKKYNNKKSNKNMPKNKNLNLSLNAPKRTLKFLSNPNPKISKVATPFCRSESSKNKWKNLPRSARPSKKCCPNIGLSTWDCHKIHYQWR